MSDVDRASRRDRDDDRKRRRTLVVIGTLVVLPLLIIGGAGAWFWLQLDPIGSPGAKVEVQIERGWSIPKIGDELTHQGIISSSVVFSVYARLNGDTKFQAGTYELRKHMGVRDAVKAMKAGPRIDFTNLAVPPGLWLKEIADRVGKLPGRSGEAFLEASGNDSVRSKYEPDSVHNLEGLLWPDTYKISAEEDEIQVLNTMAKTFDQKADALGLLGANVRGHSFYEIITVASMIEAEAKFDVDRPLIASVIYNRLERSMPLQVDATLIYARGDAKNRSISDADKLINSPYNTYAHTGLPPTPIAAPSEASLKAALNPATTTYLYYVVVNKDGHHAFASTLQEHQHNIDVAKQNGAL